MHKGNDKGGDQPPNAALYECAQRLRLYGLLAHWDEVATEPWLPKLLEYEQTERTRRSLERRVRDARLGYFTPLAEFDWSGSVQIDRPAVEQLFSLRFIELGANVVLMGPTGVGKTMLLKNLAHRVLVGGYTVRFCLASDMLYDLAAADKSNELNRRLQRYCRPQLLCIDEFGYSSCNHRYAALLFEVVTRRFETRKPIAIGTNKPLAEWPQVLSGAPYVAPVIDRLLHRCKLIEIPIRAHSHRPKTATERAAKKEKTSPKSHPPKGPRS